MAQLFNLIAGFLHCRCNWFPFASFCREAITCGKLHRIGTACFSLKSPDILSLFFMLLVFLKTNLFFFEYRIGTIFFTGINNENLFLFLFLDEIIWYVLCFFGEKTD